jgi:hypothetical protein
VARQNLSMSTTDAFLPFDDRGERDDLDVEEGLALGEEEDNEEPDFSETDTPFRAPKPGSRLTADELESDLDES